MSVVQAGSVNLTAQIVPNLIVQILAPALSQLNGLPTNIVGVVGTAQWGPKNAPTIVGSMADYARQFGAIQNRTYDMGTTVALAVLQGANNFRCVRVTDGTDTAASVVVQTTCITLTAKYTGTLGNSLQASIGPGSAASSYKISLALPGQAPEVFDNITGTGNALWLAMAAAINNGQGGMRGPSQIVVASAGVGTTAPATSSYTLTGGTDGAATITSSVLIGVDTVPRTGMYALRNTKASIGVLSDVSDTTSFSTQVSFGLSEGIYMIGVSPAGDSISTAVTAKATAGIDSYAFKYMLGDWLYFLDTVNNVTRMVSPQGVVAGLLGNLSPEVSSLNKQVYGIVGTQKSFQNLTYSDAELQALGGAGIDVICNPIPRGDVFGVRFGRNSSSSQAIRNDTYTRLTNYMAYTLNQGMGRFVGENQTTLPNDPLRRRVGATLSSFCSAMKETGQLADFSVQCDNGNNSNDRITAGWLTASVKAVYPSVVEYLLVNLEGGQTVTVTRQATQSR